MVFWWSFHLFRADNGIVYLISTGYRRKLVVRKYLRLCVESLLVTDTASHYVSWFDA